MYSRFESIKLEDTGLMRKSTKDPVYSRLSKNGISNLKELFELDDLDKIIYGSKDFLGIISNTQAKGVVKLLRTNYLMEEYPHIHILNSTIHEIYNDKEYNKDISNTTWLISILGLHRDFAYALNQSKYANRNQPVINELERIYLDELPVITTKYTRVLNKRRIGVILKWYYANIYGLKLNLEKCTAEELKQKAIILKSIPDKRQEYILTLIQLEWLIFLMEKNLAQMQSNINKLKK